MCPRIFLFLAVSFFGCSAANPNLIREDSYRVSIKSNGVEQKDFNQQLVHRLSVKSSELKLMSANGQENLLLPFSFESSLDLSGNLSGLKIKSTKTYPGVNSLGLQPGDLITAFGLVKPNGRSDFWKLFVDLNKDKQASITLQRAGRPHKILYYVEN
jgi:hypothetical protein